MRNFPAGVRDYFVAIFGQHIKSNDVLFISPSHKQQSMDLPPDKAKLLKNYDNEKKWDIICDQVRRNQHRQMLINSTLFSSL